MTREEAIKYLKKMKDECNDTFHKVRYVTREEALDMAIKALEQEPCEDAIDRAEAMTEIMMFAGNVKSDEENIYIKVSDAVQLLRELPSIQPTAKENLVVGDCISREFIEIVVEYPPADLCTYPEYKGKPYYSIKYRENGENHVGFGTYKIEMLSQWIKEYFMPSIQTKTDMWSIKDVKDCFIKHGLITEQEPKTGHWIDTNEDGFLYHRIYKCSHCGDTVCDYPENIQKYKYCPNCGAKMESEVQT